MNEEPSKERAALFDHPDVWGAGITEIEGRMALRVYVRRDSPDVRAFIPSVVDGLPTVVQVGDPPVAL